MVTTSRFGVLTAIYASLIKTDMTDSKNIPRLLDAHMHRINIGIASLRFGES